MSILSFLISVFAGIVANYIFAILTDSDNGDGTSKEGSAKYPEVNEVKFAASVSFSERQELTDPANGP